MDRATFEKIVGGANYDWSSNIGYAIVWNMETGSKVMFDVCDGFTVTPFQVRCGCFAIGVPCDWDEPVTFERLMELEGAKSSGNEIVGIQINQHDWLTFYFVDGEWRFPNSCKNITTMRQVHLLLEAAGVGE